MDKAEPLKLTEEEIEAARSPRGGWTAAQLATWGVPWPPPKGWRQALLKGEPVVRVQSYSITVTMWDGSQKALAPNEGPDAVWKIGAALLANKVTDWKAITVTLENQIEEIG